MNRIVADLLTFNSEPPDEDYSPLIYGEQIGSKVTAGVASEIVVACWQLLPATLAETFLEGLLQNVSIEEPVITMLHCLEKTREVSSASSIVRILRRRYNASNERIVEYAANKLSTETDHAVQNRMAYAILSAGLATLDQKRIAMSLERTGELSGYAIECLEEAISRSNIQSEDTGG